MADYISREAASERITALINKSGKYTDYESGADDACFILEHEIPAADVVEVVRCKDCKHWTGINCGYCEVWEHYISNQNYFCGSGEMGGDNG